MSVFRETLGFSSPTGRDCCIAVINDVLGGRLQRWPTMACGDLAFPLTARAMKAGRHLRRTRQWLSVVLGAGARHRVRIRAEWRLSWMTREHRAFHQTRSADVGQEWRAQASKCVSTAGWVSDRSHADLTVHVWSASIFRARLQEPNRRTRRPRLHLRIAFSNAWQRVKTT
jgi:hypothetical protein